MNTGKLYTVGELAKRAGVTVRTLQYYDKQNLLKPSALSEGGRRLYSNKDEVRLHQIVALKSLGFSLDEIRDKLFNLDSPTEVMEIIGLQKQAIQSQIEMLQGAVQSIDALCDEIKQMDTVDFEKYAYIISVVQQGALDYWMVKLFDNTLLHHLKEHYFDKEEDACRLYNGYLAILDETLAVKQKGAQPTDEEAMQVAGKWWAMVVEFTGGDISLLPRLMEFNETKDGWDETIKEKQQEVDDFIGKALESYLEKAGVGALEEAKSASSN